MTGFHKRVHSLGTFWAGLTDMVRDAPERHAIVRQQRLDRTFIEQLSLVVSRVNGCRLCTYVHAANALRSGLSDGELQELLVFELGQVPPERAVALTFAQHFAESGGDPDPVVERRLQHAYGAQQSRDMVTYLRYAQFGSLNGATNDAFLHRLRGEPVPHSRLLTELVVFVLTGPVMLPKLALIERARAYDRVRSVLGGIR